MKLSAVLRAVAIGVVLFGVISFGPPLLLRLQGIGVGDNTPQPEEPIHRDADGKRINSADHAILTGYNLAAKRGITSHQACRDAYPTDRESLLRSGCSRHVTEGKRIGKPVRQGAWDSGKTTAQCQEEVNAYWSAVVQDWREQGQDQAASVNTRRNWMPELQACGNYDNARASKVVTPALSRLNAVLAKMEMGQKPSPEEQASTLQDMQQVSLFAPHEMRSTYLAKADRYLALSAGLERPRHGPLDLTCAGYQEGLERLRQAERTDAEAQAQLRQGDRITDGDAWNRLNDARIERLWSVRRYTEAAHAKGCVL